MKLAVGQWCRAYSRGIWRISRIEPSVVDYDWQTDDWSSTKRDMVFLRRIVGATFKKSFAAEINDSSLVFPLGRVEQAQLDEFLEANPKLLEQFNNYAAPDPDSVLNISTSLSASELPDIEVLFQKKTPCDCKTILKHLRSSSIGKTIGMNPIGSTIQFVSPQTRIKRGKIEYIFSRVLNF
jgi:hypothetical protein